MLTLENSGLAGPSWVEKRKKKRGGSQQHAAAALSTDSVERKKEKGMDPISAAMSPIWYMSGRVCSLVWVFCSPGRSTSCPNRTSPTYRCQDKAAVVSALGEGKKKIIPRRRGHSGLCMAPASASVRSGLRAFFPPCLTANLLVQGALLHRENRT